MANVICGTESRVSINITNLDNAKLSDCDFTATFYTTDKENNKYVVNKAQMAKRDDDTYVCVVDTGFIGVGRILVEILLFVPDVLCSDGNRKEIVRSATDITVIA